MRHIDHFNLSCFFFSPCVCYPSVLIHGSPQFGENLLFLFVSEFFFHASKLCLHEIIPVLFSLVFGDGRYCPGKDRPWLPAACLHFYVTVMSAFITAVTLFNEILRVVGL